VGGPDRVGTRRSPAGRRRADQPRSSRTALCFSAYCQRPPSPCLREAGHQLPRRPDPPGRSAWRAGLTARAHPGFVCSFGCCSTRNCRQSARPGVQPTI
jgi:hypothetical protein